MKAKKLGLTLAGTVLAACVAGSAWAADPTLPRSMVWSAYDLGSSGYAEASGIANALQTKYKTRIRIVPAGTSIGRLLPMSTGKVQYGFLANEAFFAAEGTYDFAVPEWGPQDLRIVLGRPATVGFAVAKDTGVKEISDLRGKRIGFVKGNPSVNVKNDAYLTFGGLTRDDVEVVWFGSYAAMKDAVLANQLDAFGSVTTSSNMRQIEASPRGLIWPPFRPENKTGWEAMTKVISFVEPAQETKGAALSEENPVWLVGYRYPMVTTYARTSEEEVYNLIKAIDESFDLYKNTTASSSNWAVARAGRPPADAPWHDGAIRYMKEKGLWTEQDQAWHDKRLARLNQVIEAWDMANEAFDKMRAEEREKGNKIDVKEAWPAYWEKYRAE
ncbi:MAG: TAXI family TRAP transporter solute-binding subunit, partial [Gammaproteobacteria bacterium]|nr:TAXI family TRAP transporter solute-binding subunit [Gammaproteobacteria bacterium]